MNLIAVVVLFGLTGILFYELFVRLNVMRDIRQVFNVAPSALKVIRSTTLSDEQKEKSIRRMSLTVLQDTFSFTAKLAGILLACIALAAATQFLFTLSPEGLGDLLTSWQGLVAAVATVAIYARFKPTHEAALARSSTRHYSLIDRLLHWVAFAHPGLQKILGDVENDLFKKQLAGIETIRPTFVTGLPRAGTTLLLELLHDTGQFASFTYRQMPFVLNPLLWNRLSASSRQQGKQQERAHGDGMLISYDSPEAFEEVLWINHLDQSMFDEAGIRPLKPADLDNHFRAAFINLARKLVCLKEHESRKTKPATTSLSEARKKNSEHPFSDEPVSTNANSTPSVSHTTAARSFSRYLSKNNANLSRLDAIRSVFADADLLLCYRHPGTHVVSLHTQHLRFLDLHESDSFSRTYMRWVGHHDLGANFRAIQFNGQINIDPRERLFWLQYWVDAYRFVLEHAPARTQFIGYESLLINGVANLGQLAKNLDLNEAATATLTAAATRLRAQGSTAQHLSDLSADLAAEAEAVHDQLEARSVAQGYTALQQMNAQAHEESSIAKANVLYEP